MKKIIITLVAVLVAVFFIGLVFSGVLPLALLDGKETTTQTFRRGIDEWAGNYKVELLGPNSRKGYICSYRDNGMSETITIQGHISKWDYEIPWSSIEKYKYLVFLKENSFDSWEDDDGKAYSQPGKSSMYLSNPNPGVLKPVKTSYPGYLEPYSFELVGNRFSKGAIKVELWAYFDLTPLEIGGPGKEWYRMAIDEAVFYEGFGGLYFDTDTNGLPVNTYAVGETGKIHVETTYGGQTVGETNKPWEVIMRYPEDRGGGIVKQQNYGDMAKSVFEFTITSDMFSTSSNNEYIITLYNTILPQAEIRTRTIDIMGSVPGDVVYSGPTKIKNGDTINLELSAIVNGQTQLPISYFRVGIYYGGQDSTIPTDPLSERWIIPVTNFGDVSHSGNEYSTTISFKPNKPKYEGFITAWAVAYDTEGRGSEHSEKWTLYVWADSGEPPDETISDEVGQDHDYGGHSENWLPWDPSGGNWDKIKDTFMDHIVGFIVCILIILVCSLLALKVTMPYGLYGKALLIFVSVVIGILAFIFL